MKYTKQWVHAALFEMLILFVFTAVSAELIWAEETPESLVIGYQAVPNPQTVVKEMGWHEKELEIPIKWVKKDTADFLEKEKQIEISPAWPIFMRAVSASYAQKMIPPKKGLAAPRLKTE